MNPPRKMLVLITFCVTFPLAAQSVKLPETHNAALRYWMAFALMRDTPTDAATDKFLADVLSGASPWDEDKLGPFVDQNMKAIMTMQRAAKLSECNWGLEYDLGPDAPIAHLAKARVLARLNVLYGIRMLAMHENTKAVDAWLDGLRFSQHLAQGAPLISGLSAKAALVDDLRAMNFSLRAGTLDDASLAKIGDAVRTLPEYGFDWNRTVTVEAAAVERALWQFKNSTNQSQLYKEWFLEAMPANVSGPSKADIAQYQATMNEAAAAFGLPYAPAKQALVGIQVKITKLNPIAQRSIPSLARINEQREEVAVARERLLKAIDAAEHSKSRPNGGVSERGGSKFGKTATTALVR